MSEAQSLRHSNSIPDWAKFVSIPCKRCFRNSMFEFTEELDSAGVMKNGVRYICHRAIYHWCGDGCGMFVVVEENQRSDIQQLRLPFDE